MWHNLSQRECVGVSVTSAEVRCALCKGQSVQAGRRRPGERERETQKKAKREVGDGRHRYRETSIGRLSCTVTYALTDTNSNTLTRSLQHKKTLPHTDKAETRPHPKLNQPRSPVNLRASLVDNIAAECAMTSAHTPRKHTGIHCFCDAAVQQDDGPNIDLNPASRIRSSSQPRHSQQVAQICAVAPQP